MDTACEGWSSGTGRWWTSASGVRVWACEAVGGGLRLVKNSPSARFSIASTECRLNQLVRLGMEKVSSGGREAVGGWGEVGEVAVEVVDVVGGWGRKEAKPVTDELDEGDTGGEVDKGETGERSEGEEATEEGELRDDGLLRFADTGRVGECMSDSAKMEADEEE